MKSAHFESLWGGMPGVTFESLLSHLNAFCVSLELGGRRLHKFFMRSSETDFLSISRPKSAFSFFPISGRRPEIPVLAGGQDRKSRVNSRYLKCKKTKPSHASQS